MSTVAKKSASEIANRFAAVLQCKVAAVPTRMIFLGHSVACSRCGGSGSYSYNPKDGTRCFGCGGAGKRAATLTPALLEQVRADVAAGKLQPYLERLARKARVKGYNDRFFAAWGALPTVAADAGKHWTQDSPRHREINTFCAALCDEVRPLLTTVTDGAWDKAARRYVPASPEAVDAALDRLEVIMNLVTKAEELAPRKGEVTA